MKTLLIKLLVKASDALIVKGVRGLKTNPRAIEFALNYALGTGKSIELTEDEIDHTAYMLFNYSRDYQYRPEEMKKGNDINFHPYHIVTSDYNRGITLLQRYLTDPTLGIVGDFNATFQEHYVQCTDTWDFNCDTSFEFTFQGYYWILWMLGQLLNLFDIDWFLEPLEGDKFSLSIEECDLSFLNDTHSFDTTWDIPWQKMACDIRRPRIPPIHTPLF